MDDKLWHYRARLVRVVDGDTLDLEMDTGFRSRHVERIRVADVDAAKGNTLEGIAATAFVEAWYSSLAGEWPLVIRTRRVKIRSGDSREVFSYERFVADVFARSTGESLSELLLDEGHGAVPNANN